jgi:cytidine deaminase
VTPGCNWENCTYQSTCAERCAIVAANAKGQRQSTAVAIVGYSGKAGVAPAADQLCAPCGLCRQMLNEVNQLTGKAPMDIILVAGDKKRAAVVPLSTLLPESFGPADFGLDITAWSVVKAAAAAPPKAAAALMKAAAAPKKAAAAPKKAGASTKAAAPAKKVGKAAKAAPGAAAGKKKAAQKK